LADGYEHRWLHYLAITRRHGLDALAPRPGERILDAACGTGRLLAELAARPEELELTGLDVSTTMLELARQTLPVSVRLLEGRLEQLPIEDDSFDAVTSFNALHYSDEPGTVLREFQRVLVPGGRLVIVDWRRDWLMMPLLSAWLRVNKRPMGRLLSTRQLATLAGKAGFAVDGLNAFRIRPAWALMTLRAHRAA